METFVIFAHTGTAWWISATEEMDCTVQRMQQRSRQTFAAYELVFELRALQDKRVRDKCISDFFFQTRLSFVSSPCFLAMSQLLRYSALEMGRK